MPVRERTRQRLPPELTTPIVADQHLSAFIRGSDYVNIAHPRQVLLTTSTSHFVPTELLAFPCGLGCCNGLRCY